MPGSCADRRAARHFGLQHARGRESASPASKIGGTGGCGSLRKTNAEQTWRERKGQASMAESLDQLASFLIEAKRRTYAGLDDNASVSQPLLSGSKQLEHRDGPYAYRDIYFGMAFFVGLETVSKNERVIWSMSYGGGVRPEIVDRARILSTYEFLRQALLAVNGNVPCRGPASFSIGDRMYLNRVEGTLDRFCGTEEISECHSTLYELHYSGGLLR
jgi:hypothetical protein